MKTKNQNRRLNINALRSELRSSLQRRAKFQKEQDSLWDEVRRGYNRTTQLKCVNQQIGAETHKINCVITQLIRTGQMTSHDCSLARSYLQSEIARNQKIVSSWQKIISEVEHGRKSLINGAGITHTDTRSSRQYVTNKKQRIAEAQRLLAALR